MLLLSGKFCSSNVGCSGNYDWLLQAAKCAASRFCSATFLRQRFGYSVSLCKVSRFFSFFHGICPHLKYWRDSKVLTFNRKLFLVKVYRTLWFKLVVVLCSITCFKSWHDCFSEHLPQIYSWSHRFLHLWVKQTQLGRGGQREHLISFPIGGWSKHQQFWSDRLCEGKLTRWRWR